MHGQHRERLAAARIAAEIAAALLAASLAVAALEGVAPVAGLGVVYLLAVLAIAIRRGEVAALATAALAVLALNFFFIQPRHRLTISDSRNVAALIVFLITAAVVGRLAADAHQRAQEAHARADETAAREREAALLATTASSLLGSQGEWEPPDLGGAAARLSLTAAPVTQNGELAIRLPTNEQSCWLYVDGSCWKKADAKRIAKPLADVIDLELSRHRLAETAAEAEAARRADVAKTALLHAVSHDLRSPLTAITTATAALNSGVIDEADRSDLLSVLEGEAARLERLIGDLLTLSRIEAGAESPDVDWCDVGDTVASAAEHVRAAYPDEPIEIDIPEDLALVRADPVQLQRVFANLIENAVKFSPRGEPVRISGGGDARVVVSVSNGGRPIPPSQRAHVFEPFFRGDGSAGGSGLGLAISRGFVEANGGRIALGRAGNGTTFNVSFPAARRPSEVT